MSSPGPDIDHVYAILRQWAAEETPDTYKELSHAYFLRTGQWFEPHGSWDAALGVINNRLAKVGAPALSALVILQDTGEPGGQFWGYAPNVPRRPSKGEARTEAWLKIYDDVINFDWPQTLP